MEKFLLIVINISLPPSFFTQLDDDVLSDNIIEQSKFELGRRKELSRKRSQGVGERNCQLHKLGRNQHPRHSKLQDRSLQTHPILVRRKIPMAKMQRSNKF
jgi:hypothetical protein